MQGNALLGLPVLRPVLLRWQMTMLLAIPLRETSWLLRASIASVAPAQADVQTQWQ